MGPGGGGAACAQDQSSADQLSNQLAAFATVPSPDEYDGDAGDDWFDREPIEASEPSEEDDASALAPQPPAGSPFAVLRSWSFAVDSGAADQAPSRPFLLDMPVEGEAASLDADSVYEPGAEKSAEPHDFRISDNLKVKAQPIGGGLGGRVTLTFSFPTGY